ncbi:MAG: hypothetical protein NC206_08180 [Bacteroides sp.]|nr:hypothetical protein [Roseburia sp.]MCM1347046.1 hypothetical protein [Bacteroides sp.]
MPYLSALFVFGKYGCVAGLRQDKMVKSAILLLQMLVCKLLVKMGGCNVCRKGEELARN